MPEILRDIRCRCCGGLIATGRYNKDLTLYCSDVCSETPVSKYPETEIRDEVACELVLQGVSILQAAQAVGMGHQHLHQVLDRRGVRAALRGAAA